MYFHRKLDRHSPSNPLRFSENLHANSFSFFHANTCTLLQTRRTYEERRNVLSWLGNEHSDGMECSLLLSSSQGSWEWDEAGVGGCKSLSVLGPCMCECIKSLSPCCIGDWSQFISLHSKLS